MRSCVLLLLALTLPAAAQDVKVDCDRAKAALSQVDGDIRVPGLKQPVEIVRDKWGVPHIFAQNARDLFFAQGFVAAQDRLFQIDLWRRQATGELAEILGPSAVEADAFARLIRYRGDMDAEWRSYSPDTRDIAAAFTAGINACIDHMGDKLPIEFQLLGYRPKRWQPEDILGRSSGIYMSQNFRNEVERLKLIQLVGLEKAQWLAPVDPAHEYKLQLSADDVKVFPAQVLRGYEALTRNLSFTPAKTESNNWVVSGQRSLSGKPLLASDPHRAIANPGLRYIVHLNAPGWNVIGAGEPGLPGVALGHNEHIAWGITIVGVDQADIVVEKTDTENPNYYQASSEYASMKTYKESIAVKGAKPTEVTLRYTRNGPVLHVDEKNHRAYALRWTGSDPGGAAYLGGLAVARAHNQKDFLRALESWKTPGLNFAYADVEGNIGWVAAARTPIRGSARDGHDGLLPVPGAGFEWSGYLKVSQYPQRFNPKEGFIATANHNILPKGYPHTLGFEFAPPYRFQRLHDLLASRPKWELNDFRALQQDSVSLPARSLVKLLQDADVPADQEEAARVFAKWDGQLSVDSPAGSLYALWLKELTDEFCGRHIDKKYLKTLTSLSGLPVMIKALEEPDPRWLGNDATKARQKLLRESFAKAVAKWQKLPDDQRQRWGALHTVTFRHPAARAFDVGPFERPGDGNSPNNTKYDDKFKQVHGATYRQLFDLADWDRGLATNAPGQSGQPGSPHYDDLAPMWARGDYFPLAYSRKKVDEVAQNRLWLRSAD